MKKETFTIPGIFGDRHVIINRLSQNEDTKKIIVLFHGVHGCASLEEGNKYAVLAEMLLPLGFTVYLTETSRIRRDRSFFGDDRECWARTAFKGKTYAMDLFDVSAALEEIEKRHMNDEIYLWGFSLGGIHSILMAGGSYREKLVNGGLCAPSLDVAPAGIIVSGSGDSLDDRDESLALKLPILDTIGDNTLLYKSAHSIRSGWFVSFYGENDQTFSMDACRRLFDAVSTSDKEFIVIPGADHAFRKMRGLASIQPLKKMVSHVKARLME
ncbi:MAG: alpha/beta hydrolase [Aminobacterium sp.]|jgi:dienelactone hydrolase|uniref:alpha/beta hydrolase n=1 Tax=unclassified Aminobacterium TaxID=2685012 RepID=UPI001BCD6C88|nr:MULTISPECIES: alpha/beta hydrolase [unclassified Aminobacterium]MDD2206585.1 alpha/beta hydrolase [Aminobacterium sp.]MDD3425502.1 alpha/beta hydrolase [Aminobacterium sp.]MDD3706851.1 alpha/beta hydrolase [Aminobacterium sp.]MDD4228668.1 alpha/beta hydrolase [Aminobacterium sp.]MDD4551596.1 alpha/beta hydrolase [Aminobacterium sp.]